MSNFYQFLKVVLPQIHFESGLPGSGIIFLDPYPDPAKRLGTDPHRQHGFLDFEIYVNFHFALLPCFDLFNDATVLKEGEKSQKDNPLLMQGQNCELQICIILIKYPITNLQELWLRK